MEDALLSPMGMAVLSGAGLIEATQENTVYVHKTADVEFIKGSGDTQYTATINGDSKFKVVVPADGREFYVVMKDSYGELTGETQQYAAGSTDATVVGNVLTIKLPSTATAGGAALVDYYVEAKSNVSTIEITPDNFGGYFYVEGSCLFRQEKDGKDFPAEITIPKIKVQSNFTFNMASSGDPSTFTFTCDAFPAYIPWGDKQKKVLADIQIIDPNVGE